MPGWREPAEQAPSAIRRQSKSEVTRGVICKLNTISLNVTWLPTPVVRPLNGNINKIPRIDPSSDSKQCFEYK